MLLTQLPTGLTAGASLREMTLADVPAVHQLELNLFPADAWPLEMFLAEITQETRGYIVLEIPTVQGPEVIGYAGLMSIAETADVQTIAIAPAYQGRGYGQTLLSYLAAEARARGAEQILLEVRADNPRAQKLYLKNGYQQIHLRRRYYNDGVDALIMRKDLTDQPSLQGESSHDR